MDEIIADPQDNNRGQIIAYIFIIATFLLPYLIGWTFSDNYQVFMVYMPVWFIGIQNGVFFGGPSPMAFLMIPYWIPYTILGFLTLKYARGDYSSKSIFLIRVISIMLIAVVLFSCKKNETPQVQYEDMWTEVSFNVTNIFPDADRDNPYGIPDCDGCEPAYAVIGIDYDGDFEADEMFYPLVFRLPDGKLYTQTGLMDFPS